MPLRKGRVSKTGLCGQRVDGGCNMGADLRVAKGQGLRLGVL